MGISKEIESLQTEIDRRTEVEEKAIQLITAGKYQEAIELLKSI